MSRILIPLIKAIKNNKWVRTAQLALTPFTEKPLNHLTSSTNWMYVWSQSLLAASLYAYASKVLFDGAISRRAALAKSAAAAIDMQHAWQRYTFLFQAESAVLMLTLIFAVASTRWAYNACASTWLKRLYSKIKRPPFSFFVLVSSGYALWFSFFAWVVAKMFSASDGKPKEYVQQLEMSHPLWIVAACFVVYFVTSGARKQQRRGMEEIYGGSRRLVLLLDVGVVILCITCLSLLGYLAEHPGRV
jgi:hypothetical protein